MAEEANTKGVPVGYPNPYPPPPPPHPQGQQPQPPPLAFQGVNPYPPPPHAGGAGGFPQPVPPGAAGYPPPPPTQYYSQPVPVPGYAVEEGRPGREHLPCCGCGLGWVLFIIGFFLGAIPWYIGTLILLFARHRMDDLEKPGYYACVIAAVLSSIVIIIAAATGSLHPQ